MGICESDNNIKVKYQLTNTAEIFDINISPEKTMNDLIDIFYKNNRIAKMDEKYFLCNGYNIALEEYKNKKIKDFIDLKEVQSLIILVVDKI